MRRASVVLCLAILGACAAAPLPGREPALDPSNPEAPQSKPLPVSTAFTPALAEEPEKGGDHEGHPRGAMHDGQHGSAEPDAVEYTCPMHPEVSQPGPGRCPKCGMPLVPRDEKAQRGPSGDAHPPQNEGHEGHEERR